jgi:hypothetical protein
MARVNKLAGYKVSLIEFGKWVAIEALNKSYVN